jgi:hypothetical protein
MVVCAENVVGKQSVAVLSLGVTGSESPDGFEVRLQRRWPIDGSGGGVGVLRYVGGNALQRVSSFGPGSPVPFELVTGVNLPMLITALANRHYMPLAQLAQKLGR